MDLKSKMNALTDFLSDLYDSPETRISLLLSRSGFTPAEIATLRACHAESLAAELIDIVRTRVFENRERLFRTISCRYGLSREKPLSLTWVWVL